MKSLPPCGGQKGLVFNIQRFSVHDGPGIRTTVFMKGCPLRCSWCSNPESQDFLPSLMARDIRCKGCGACVSACPIGAISISAEIGRIIDRNKCDRCMACAAACLYQSLAVCGVYMEADEVVREVLKDRPFYNNSGGGITVSGGEALSQHAFVFRILERCREEGLHTVLDTSGHGPWESLEHLLPLVDLLLFDLKHLDSDEHKRTTGADNELILANLERAAKRVPIWLRVPLIAGFNDSEEHILNIASLGKQMGVRKVSFLPYHEGGKTKSAQLGCPYKMPEAAVPSDEHIQALKRLVESTGLRVAIGN